MVDMALLSRTVVSLGRPFEDGEFIGKTTPPDDLQHRLPPTTSTSTPKRGHATPLTSHFKMAELHSDHDLIVFLADAGLADPERILDNPAVVRLQGAEAHRYEVIASRSPKNAMTVGPVHLLQPLHTAENIEQFESAW
ncbi:hypothetical protein [Streptomyces sp. NBC_00057]|uniref:hypothetical protein n=1 Tax=Streptomyces sp. NBC_00057 TaxID=2975634 RepID=UPI00324896F8